MDVKKYFEEHGFRSASSGSGHENEGIETIFVEEVAKNEDGLILLEFEKNICDTMVAYETVEELFPDYEFDIDKGYLFKLDDTLYFE